MAKKWSEVSQSEAFLALPPEQKEAARNQYFDQVVTPQIGDPSQVPIARQQFDAQTRITDLPGINAEPPDFSDVTATVSTAADKASNPANDSAFARMVSGKPSPQPEGSALGRFLGQIGGREVLQGAYGLYGSLGGDALDYAVLGPLDRKLGTNLGTGGRGYRQAASDLADSMGMYKPQTAQERIVSGIGEALTGTGLTLGIGSGINALANMGKAGAASSEAGNLLLAQPMLKGPAVGTATYAAPAANRLANFLTTQPVLQGISTVTGATASGSVRESGGSQGQQLAAGLLGGLGPGVANAAAGATLRGAVRGTSGQQMRNRLADFEALGANPSVGQASGNRLIQGAESLLAGGPTSAGVMGRFAERQADDIGQGVRNAGTSLSRAADSPAAGRAIQKGIHGPDGFTKKYKATQNELFNKLDDHIPAQTAVDTSNTREALGQLNAPINGAPNVSGLFKNARVAGIGSALEKDLAIPTAPQVTLDDALARLDRVYASRDAASQDAGRFAAFANDQANAANRHYPVDGMPRVPGRYTPAAAQAKEGAAAASEATDIARGRVSQAQEIEETIGDLQAAAAASNGRLPYEAVKKLRTLVGQEIEESKLVGGFPRSKFKALYAALSRDLERAATEAGPAAMQAYRRANNYTRMGMERAELVSRAIDKKGGPEAVFQAAMAGTKEGASTLRAVMQSIPKDAQKAVTAAVVKRLGRARSSAQPLEGDAFSADTFLTRWNDLSDDAKRVLFDRHGPGFSRDMDRIARVAATVKQGGKAFSNPPGTADRVAAQSYAIGLPLAVVQAPFTGQYWPIAAAVGGGIGANVAARVLTSPLAVGWLAQSTRIPIGSMNASIQQLARAAERRGDDAALELANALAEKNPEKSPSQSSERENNGGN